MSNIDITITHFCEGRIIILIDDSDRENEADFIQVAESVTPESVNFMISHGKGLLCHAIPQEVADRLQLKAQTQYNTSLHTTAFTESVDYLRGTTTGISAPDRAKTIQAIADASTPPELLGRPGHIFPIIAHKEGLHTRRGHTEAAVALATLSPYPSNSAIICEILNDKGLIATLPELRQLASAYNLDFIHIQELVDYLQQRT